MSNDQLPHSLARNSFDDFALPTILPKQKRRCHEAVSQLLAIFHSSADGRSPNQNEQKSLFFVVKKNDSGLGFVALRNNSFQESLARRLRILLTGDPNGIPPWLDIVAAGNERGLFLPTDAPWVAHADLATLVGGVRALLMQALHPGSLAGVRSHSRYKDDPLGRLSGTIRWLTITTYGSYEAVMGEACRVNRIHDHVTGQYRNVAGNSLSYRASDPDLLQWVHIAFMDSFLRSHQTYSTRPLPGGADAYIRLWSKSVEPLGLSGVPMDEAGLLAEMKRYHAQLVVTDDTRDTIEWIKNPPLPVTSRRVYALLFQSAVASLPEEYQTMMGLRSYPLEILRPLTTGVLQLMRLAIGPDSVFEDAAIQRLHRAGLMVNGKIVG